MIVYLCLHFLRGDQFEKLFAGYSADLRSVANAQGFGTELLQKACSLPLSSSLSFSSLRHYCIIETNITIGTGHSARTAEIHGSKRQAVPVGI